MKKNLKDPVYVFPGIIDQLTKSGLVREQGADYVDNWEDKLDANAYGNPRPTLANAAIALKEAPEWMGVLAFDEFRLRTVALRRTPWGATPDPWTDTDDLRVAQWLQHHKLFVAPKTAAEAVEVAAHERAYHPVRQYLDSLKWDGTGRLDNWLPLYLGVEQSEYARAVGARWLISAIARVRQPGAKADCCLILEGPQGAGKSSVLRGLAGEWFADELADLGSKDAALQLCGVWVVELAELDSLSRAESATAKAYISRSTDHIRLPYGRRTVDLPRQCVFAGSVNHSSYLQDETGGRRYWPVTCGRILLDELARDRDQLWAEAAHRYATGAKWWLDDIQLIHSATDQQSARYVTDVWQPEIADWIDGREDVSVGELLGKLLDKPKGQWSQADANRVGRCLRALGWQRYQMRISGRREWRYRQPSH